MAKCHDLMNHVVFQYPYGGLDRKDLVFLP